MAVAAVALGPQPVRQELPVVVEVITTRLQVVTPLKDLQAVKMHTTLDMDTQQAAAAALVLLE
jgi:PII-like signaling protein